MDYQMKKEKRATFNRRYYHEDITSCSEALQTRLVMNRQLGTRDFDGWVIRQLQPKRGEHILDIGCGTGKFTIPCAETVGSEGCVVGLDISKDSLDKLRAQAESQSLRIKTICAKMEDLSAYLSEYVFDAAISSYALYYSEKPEQTINDICQCLEKKGRLLVVSPDKGNNEELLTFLKPIIGIPQSSSYNQSFTYQIVIPLCKVLFMELRKEHFENPVTFPSAQLLMEYWRSGGYYRPEAESFVQKAIDAHFSENSEFILHKRTVAVLAIGVST
jgi:ubiquinone/menaquinone biosynthesis C-methylase UbiE